MLRVKITISLVLDDNVIDDFEIEYQSLIVITFESKILNFYQSPTFKSRRSILDGKRSTGC